MHKAVLTFQSVDEITCIHSNECNWAGFFFCSTIQFIVLYKVVVAFDLMDKIQKSEQSG